MDLSPSKTWPSGVMETIMVCMIVSPTLDCFRHEETFSPAFSGDDPRLMSIPQKIYGVYVSKEARDIAYALQLDQIECW
ncbi:hypothetical protein ACMFMF_008372 [Clarireedia jacksonii]